VRNCSFTVAELPQTGGKPRPGAHVRTGLQDAPEVPHILLKRSFPERSLAGRDPLGVEVAGFVEVETRLILGKENKGVGTVRSDP
jgi:hypothetical protein